MEIFNGEIADAKSKIRPIRKIFGQRQKYLDELISEFGIDEVLDVLKKSVRLVALNDGIDKPFTATFDFIINPDNFVRILEGQFDDRPQAKNDTLPATNKTPQLEKEKGGPAEIEEDTPEEVSSAALVPDKATTSTPQPDYGTPPPPPAVRFDTGSNPALPVKTDTPATVIIAQTEYPSALTRISQNAPISIEEGIVHMASEELLSWREGVCMKYQITIDQFVNLLKEFLIHCKATAEPNKPLTNLQRHFYFWIPKFQQQLIKQRADPSSPLYNPNDPYGKTEARQKMMTQDIYDTANGKNKFEETPNEELAF